MADRILRGWKEIAANLRTSVRTTQRWAKEMGLPVQHLGDSSRAPVFAYEQEIRTWMAGFARLRSTGTSDTAGSAGEALEREPDAIPQLSNDGAPARPTRKTLWLAGLPADQTVLLTVSVGDRAPATLVVAPRSDRHRDNAGRVHIGTHAVAGWRRDEPARPGASRPAPERDRGVAGLHYRARAGRGWSIQLRRRGAQDPLDGQR